MALYGEISNYPFLSKEEFDLGCHLLDQKYIAATLGQERRTFRLRLQHSLISDLVSISIAKPIDTFKNDIDLSLKLEALSWGEKDEESELIMDIDAENTDSVSARMLYQGNLNISHLCES